MATTVALDPFAIHNADGTFTVTGEVSSTAGLKQLAIGESIEDGPNVNFGLATVNPDGTFSYKDRETDFKRGDFIATAYFKDGTYVKSGTAPFTFYADGHETTVTSTGEQGTSTKFNKDGSSTVTVTAPGQTLQSNAFDTFNNGGAPENTFVFNPGHGLDVVNLFRAGGADHDTLSFKGSDFGNSIADVLQNTHQLRGGGSLIVDPTSGDTVRLTGVTKAQLVHNRADVAFHA